MFGAKIEYLASCLRLSGYCLLSLFAWILIIPITLIVPRDKNLIVVIGRQDGKFLDNAKYFFLYANQNYPQKRIVFISEDKSVVKLINSYGFEAHHYPKLKCIILLLRCGAFVADEASWFNKFRFFFLHGATAVQLWHGVWCKYIELLKWKHEQGDFSWSSKQLILRLRLLLYHLTGRRMSYDIVVATSKFYKEKVFQPAFLSKEFLITGYPRNDFGIGLTGKHEELLWSNVDTKIANMIKKMNNKKIVLIAPTFRDSGTMPMQLTYDDLLLLNQFAADKNFIFVFKLHPSDINEDILDSKSFFIYQRDADIYPLFPYFDVLISDYSSISMDFLHCDRPILFFIPENDTYLERDRQLQFDPKTMMPGRIVKNIVELMNSLLVETNQDHFIEDRQLLKKKAFDNINQKKSIQDIMNKIN